MIRIYSFVLVLYLSFKCGFGFLDEAEERITLDLIKNLEIRHWILVEESNLAPGDLLRFKNLVKWKIPVLYQSIVQLFQYFYLEESFPNINTLVVLKVSNLRIIIIILNYLTQFGKHNYLYKFNWIVFINDPWLTLEENELLVPYNCLFVIAERKNDGTYYLKEIYKVKKKTFVNYYGTWSENVGLSITNVSMYIRRRDLNNTELIMEYREEKESCITPRQCAHLEVLMDYSKLMNFRYRWIATDSLNLLESGNEIDLMNIALACSSDFIWDKVDYHFPLFKININWYIRRPRYLEQATYFIEPFSDEIWFSIFFLLIISTAVSAVLHYKLNYNIEHPNLIDYLFLPFETFCNQDGHSTKAANPQKIICFTIRFFALFIVPAYSGTIVSYLAVRKPQMPFKTLKGFVRNGKYSIGAQTRSFSHDFFQQNHDPLFENLNKNYFIDLNGSEIMNKLCNEPFAYVELDNDIYNLEEKCSIYRMRRPISFVFTATPLRKNSPFTRVFHHNFIRYYSSGIQGKMQEIMTRERMAISKSNSFKTVSVKQISYVLLIIPVGIILAVSILLCEIIFEFFKNVIKVRRNSRCYKAIIRDLEGLK